MATGRPRIVIDWELVDKLCGIFCTAEEIATILGCSVDTIDRALKREKNTSFAEYFKKMSAVGKTSLRRAQYQLAVEKHHPSMLIWLGKQHLGQKEPRNADDGAAFEDQHIPEIVIEEIDASLNDEGE